MSLRLITLRRLFSVSSLDLSGLWSLLLLCGLSYYCYVLFYACAILFICRPLLLRMTSAAYYMGFLVPRVYFPPFILFFARWDYFFLILFNYNFSFWTSLFPFSHLQVLCFLASFSATCLDSRVHHLNCTPTEKCVYRASSSMDPLNNFVINHTSSVQELTALCP